MYPKKYKVTGIGNAIVDILANVEDSFLSKHNLTKGAMKIISESDMKKLNSQIKALRKISGGSAANTIAALSSLGNPVSFIGKVGNDELGRLFEKDLKCIGVNNFIAKVDSTESGSTACCIVLVTPDTQRTMGTFIGVSGLLNPDNIDENIISQSEIIYLESYLLDSKEAIKAFEKAVRIALETGGKVSLNLSDSFCVERHRNEVFNLIKNNVNILFANEEEIKSLFETSSLESALYNCKELKNTCVITRAEKGSVVISNGKVSIIPPEKNVRVVDTTGAGDLYAAGFLHGLIRGMNPEICGRIGSIVAAEIISQHGARLLEISSDRLLERISF
jgi:sugar/nucleoside kinase (ribokinase family)